ncbi:MAG: ShlB/FhaC/HecB family hemolysin secretion/activation protein [Candidatus Omnitrophica bacterium]|nr:ShlB/FhaC/HecB family hemolysin secretion/activation protein [Candidatus Omnitrophota bacterium]
MTHKVAVICLVILSVVCPKVYAQDGLGSAAPGAVQSRQGQIKEYLERDSELKEKAADEKKAPVVEEAAPSENKSEKDTSKVVGTVFIKKIETDASDILSTDEIRSITSAYEGRELSVRDLGEMINRINELYRTRNFIAARAFLVPQKIKDGVAYVRLIEGRVGSVFVDGNRYTRSTFITKRIPVKHDDFLDSKRLQDALQRFNSIYDVKVRAELQAGSEFGRTDCLLKTTEPPNYQLSTFVDNAGRDDIGLYRVGAVAVNNSLLGYRDRFVLGAVRAVGTMSASVAYDIPINTLGTRVGASYDINQIKIIDGDFEVLDISGTSQNIGASVQHPFIAQADLLVNGFVNAERNNSTTDFSDVRLIETTVNSFTYGSDFRRIDSKGLWYSRGSLTNAFADMEGEDTFFRTNMDLSRYQLLGNDKVLILRASGQMAPDKMLPSSEQFQIGGLSTVRGYNEGALLGERGYFLSAELNFPLFSQASQWRNKLKGSLFVDHGGIFPYKPAGADPTNDGDTISGVGGGVILDLSKYFSGRVFLATPLNDSGNQGDDLKIHFYFQSVL